MIMEKHIALHRFVGEVIVDENHNFEFSDLFKFLLILIRTSGK